MEGYSAKDFHRRRYTVESSDLNKARVEVIIKVNGKVMAHVQGREPGIVAFVSRPDEEGFDLDLVQPGGFRFTDAQPVNAAAEKVAPWQLLALGLADE